MATHRTLTSFEFDLIHRLRAIPFLAGVPDRALARLAAQCSVRRVNPAETIFQEGDIGDALFVILDGEIQILRNETTDGLVLATMGAGDFFGEMALFDEGPRSATARAVNACTLLEIRKAMFHALLQMHPHLVGDTLRILSQRVREANAHRLEDLLRQNEELQAANRRLQENYAFTLQALLAALDLRDQATQGHSQRVTAYTLLLANALHVPDSECEALRLGALLHDIGKIGVPDAILRKPTSLTPAEWAIMRRHPEWGAALVERIDFLRGARDIVIAHHEKFDGSGYPYGLQGEAIPLGARIFAVADVFDAVTTFRPYREPMSPQEALGMLRAQAGTLFDPQVIAAFECAFPHILHVLRASFTG